MRVHGAEEEMGRQGGLVNQGGNMVGSIPQVGRETPVHVTEIEDGWESGDEVP